jgi:hypothetical protein
LLALVTVSCFSIASAENRASFGIGASHGMLGYKFGKKFEKIYWHAAVGLGVLSLGVGYDLTDDGRHMLDTSVFGGVLDGYTIDYVYLSTGGQEEGWIYGVGLTYIDDYTCILCSDDDSVDGEYGPTINIAYQF